MPTPNKHAFLSASAAHRWINCTAAPSFEAGFPNNSSVYADEGTLAHAICENLARREFDTTANKAALTRELNKLKKDKLFSEEMLETAEAYVDYLKAKSMTFDNPPYTVQEVRVDFSDYVPEGYGTCDCVMIGGGKLHITDYKHGKGVRVEAVGNPQMRLYALGALKHFGAIYGDTIKSVSMGICQPRISEDPSEEEMTVDELRAWGESIKPLADAAYNGHGEYHPGEWCRFCRGKAQCRARADVNSALADFKDCVPAADKSTMVEPITKEARQALGLSNLLTDTEIGELLTLGAELSKWYADLQEYALGAILDGKTIPGYKAVAGRSNRTFKDETTAFDILRNAGYTDEQLYERKAKTLTAIEKLTGKKQFADLLENEVYKPVGKPALVPESDKREPYSKAAADFAGVVSE
jgi:hypothetical protein